MHLESTDTCIAFPAAGTMVTVATDHDGASAGSWPGGERGEKIARDVAFEQQWDRWLNDEQPLTKDEIQEGLETVRRLIEEAGA